jgi:hypothetical protein
MKISKTLKCLVKRNQPHQKMILMMTRSAISSRSLLTSESKRSAKRKKSLPRPKSNPMRIKTVLISMLIRRMTS